jgi:hypothetical protein
MPNIKQKLNIDAFQADHGVTSGEAIVYYMKTKKQINVNDYNAVSDAKDDLIKLKKLIKETANALLTKDILLSSKAIVLPDGTQAPSRRIDDLCKIWSKNSSLAEQIWIVLVKRYEDMGEWEVKFEEELMEALNLEYVEEVTMDVPLQAELKGKDGTLIKVINRKKTRIHGNKGCITKVFTLVKRDIIKQFNRSAQTTHGKTITSVNPVTSFDEYGKKKYEKRKIKWSTFSDDMPIKQTKVSKN